MPDYDFRSLCSFDFEILVRDLLQAELGVRLESFGRGRDSGIDFRFYSEDGDLVVQCKHYGDYNALLRVFKRDEASKVQRLMPNRYFLVILNTGSQAATRAVLAALQGSRGHLGQGGTAGRRPPVRRGSVRRGMARV